MANAFPALFVVVFIVISIVGITRLPTLWKETPRRSARAPTWWLWGDSLWRGWMRALPAGTVSAALLGLSCCFGFLSTATSGEVHDAAWRIFAVLFVSAIFIPIVIMPLIILVNRPKFVVAPHLRKQKGLIASLLATRKRVA
jgi:uncharacterized membrane protein